MPFWGEVIIGIGGSATNDGGMGLARALGARFLDARNRELPDRGGALGRLARIDVSGLDARLKHTTISVACDVDNPLCGPRGASRVYGPQKGATPAMVVCWFLKPFIMDAATKKAVSDMVEGQGDAGSLSIDFELPGAKPGGAPSSFDETAKIMAKSQPTNVVDFDFKPEAPRAPGTSQGMDLSGISFDLGKPAGDAGAPVNSGWQEVATKLDLAKIAVELNCKLNHVTGIWEVLPVSP